MLSPIFLSLLAISNIFFVSSVQFDCDPCLDRTNYKMQAVVHGTSDDPFWQQVQATMNQAAYEMGIDFSMSLYDQQDNIDDRMASDLYALSTANLDALIVTIPTESVRHAVASFIDGCAIGRILPFCFEKIKIIS